MEFAEAFRELFPVILLAALVIALVICREWRRKHGVPDSRLETSVQRIVGAVFLICFLAGGTFMLVMMGRTASKSRVSAANSQAKHVSDAFLTAVYMLDKAGNLPDTCERVYSGQAGHAEDALLRETERAFGDYNADTYYVIVTDESWDVLSTYWSKKPITPDMIHAYSYAEQVDTAVKPFGADQLVGYFQKE